MKNNFYFFIQICLVLLILFITYHIFFSNALLTAGDFPYYFNKMMSEFSFIPFAWGTAGNNGLGNFTSPVSWPFFLFGLPTAIMANIFHFSWNYIGRILYFSPFLILGIVSIFVLLKKILLQNRFIPLAVLLYLSNTYILLLVGGGQLLYVVGYSLVPLVFWSYIRLINNGTIRVKDILLAGLFTGLLLMIDPRILYMTVVIIFLYWLVYSIAFYKKSHVHNIKKLLSIFISFVICGLINSFWIIPTIFSRDHTIISTIKAYVPRSNVQYFSFAKLENTISLLHPNWPENIFGKVGFMKPEFLLLPILAFASLLFITNKDKKEARYVLFFALLGLIGAFLAKGANDPFGGVYLWMFEHVPGFVMFRDPTKWYTLVALSYSVLIPFSVWKIYELMKKNSKFSIFNLQNLFVLLFIFFWLFTIRQAVFGQLGGTFKPTTVPSEYVSFANYLSQQKQFSRTLWVPTIQRFGFASQNHPAIAAQDFFHAYDEKSLIKKLYAPGTEKLLQELGVKYVVVPTDSQKEIFLKNNTYSVQLYQQTVTDVSKISWLKPVALPWSCGLRIGDCGLGNLAVFEVPNPKDHFFLLRNCTVAGCELPVKGGTCEVMQNSKCAIMQLQNLQFTQVSPVEYKVSVINAKKGDRLVFAESYDLHWEAKRVSKSSSRQVVKFPNQKPTV